MRKFGFPAAILAVPILCCLLHAHRQDTSQIEERVRQATLELQKGHREEPYQALRRLIPQVRETGDSRRQAQILDLLSRTALNLGHYGEAARAAGEAADIHSALHEPSSRLVAINRQGNALIFQGDYPAALSCFTEAARLASQIGDTSRRIVAENNSASVHLFQGRYSEALRHYQQGLQTAEQSGNPNGQRLSLSNLAVVYQKLGQYEKALRVYRRLDRLPGADDAGEKGQTRANLGALYRRLGDPYKALEAYREGLAVFRQARHIDGEIGVLKNIGIAQAMSFRHLEEALTSFQAALDLAVDSGNRREETQARIYLAETLLRLDRRQEARSQLEKATAIAREIAISEELWRALFGLGRLSEGKQRIDFLRQAVGVIESVRAGLNGASLRSDFLSDKKDVYDALILSLLHSRAVEVGADVPTPLGQETGGEIFRLMERSRARNFQDRLGRKKESPRERELRGRLRQISARIQRLGASAATVDPEKRREITAGMSALENEYSLLEGSLRRDDSPPTEPPSAAQIQSTLPADLLLVVFWMGRDRLTTLYLTRGDINVTVRPWGSADHTRLSECRDGLADPSDDSWQESCRGLGADLLGDALDLEAHSSLVIVPDEALSLLPFEALTVSGRLLLESVDVSYLPAASLWTRENNDATSLSVPWKPTLLGIGAPSDAALNSDTTPWSPLPQAERELRSIAGLIGGRSRLLMGSEATKPALLSSPPRDYPLIHFSTHAAVDFEFPERSRILFSPPSQQAGADYLFLSEVADLDLGGVDLVTLSACDTAWGRSVRGEGVQTFSRAFIAAGARSTVAGLWRVSDAASAHLMPLFYGFLEEGLSKAQALSRAKRQLRGDQRFAHPAYWAAFVLSGEGSRGVSLPLSWPALLTVAASVFMIVGAVLRWIGTNPTTRLNSAKSGGGRSSEEEARRELPLKASETP